MAARFLRALNGREHALAPAQVQRARLATAPVPDFEHTVGAAGGLHPAAIEVIQMNLGKRCNQTCRHCHVDAGPDRREVMPDDVVEASFDLLARFPGVTVDITGGAPELHPRFRDIVDRARSLGHPVIDRCNLTVTELPNYRDIPSFLAERDVQVVASVPTFTQKGTDAQRGAGVFESSISALQRFNALGYGHEGSRLVLTLVTNPVGAFLPGSQASLERDFKREMLRRHGIRFNHLYTITNMPISRFLEFLVESNNFEAYLTALAASFNPSAVAGLMCRSTLSIGYDGKLFDCDFNQMLEMPIDATVFDVTAEILTQRTIRTDKHCYGCTAGAGSSCGGSTVP